MPRYFFHISNKQVFAQDCEGRELPDLHAALEHVEDTYRQLALKPSEARGLAFTIADSSGRTLLTVPVPERQCQSLSLHIKDAGKHWIVMSQAVPGHLH